MKYNLLPVVNIFELEDAVNTQYGTKMELLNVLFNYDVNNDTCEYVTFNEDVDKDWGENYKEINLVYAFLRETFKDYTTILVDICW